MFSSRLVTRITQTAQRRTISSVFGGKKNTIKDIREKWYSPNSPGSNQPVHLKQPGDKIMVYAAFGGIGLGLTLLFEGLYNMSFGINKLQG